jgi:hypothetical protein
VGDGDVARLLKGARRIVEGPTTIVAYGFDEAGFEARNEKQELSDGSKLEFVRFDDPRDFSDADGVVIPQGIFEKFETRRTEFFGAKTEVWVDRWYLLEHERQIFNLLRAGKWVCFLVGRIIDDIPQGLHLESSSDTDLCKRILNAFGVERHRRYHLDVPVEVRTRDREFERYVQGYGEPTTVFEPPGDPHIEKRVIVELTDGAAVGVEFDYQLFFLPFRPKEKNWSTAVSIAKTVSQAISSYRRNRVIEIPDWVDEIRFQNEEALYLKINSSLENVNRLESELESWRDYKGILTTSGIPLKSRVIAILENFFGLRVDGLEDNHEEAIIKGDDDVPLIMFETKGADEYLPKIWCDELNLHKTIHDLPGSVAGVLVVNMDKSSHWLNSRISKNPAGDFVEYAEKQHVLILRAIDLLFLMQQLENNPRRKKRLLEILCSGGGWLKADRNSYHLMTSAQSEPKNNHESSFA